MLKRLLHTDLKYSISYYLGYIVFLFLSFTPILLNGQDIGQNHHISKVFEKNETKEEVIRLEIKRDNLLNRKHQLIITQDENIDQINRIDQMVSYINNKLESLHNRLKLEKEYQQKGIPVKGLLSDEEYIRKKHEWDKLNPELKNELKQDQV